MGSPVAASHWVASLMCVASSCSWRSHNVALSITPATKRRPMRKSESRIAAATPRAPYVSEEVEIRYEMKYTLTRWIACRPRPMAIAPGRRAVQCTDGRGRSQSTRNASHTYAMPIKTVAITPGPGDSCRMAVATKVTVKNAAMTPREPRTASGLRPSGPTGTPHASALTARNALSAPRLARYRAGIPMRSTMNRACSASAAASETDFEASPTTPRLSARSDGLS